MTHRLPTPKILLELYEPAKTQQRLNLELMYHEMRPFGRIHDIILDPKKEFATVIFNSTNSAISARNSLHFKTIGDSKFIIRYEPFSVIHINPFKITFISVFHGFGILFTMLKS
jgi:hypothetical protein